MITAEVLGKRLKFFRERAKMSQFELENLIGGANGMISRIENGKVNPSKETVLKISSILNLNNKELDYLFGNITSPVNDEEIKGLIKEIQPYFSQNKVFAYLLDDRNRVIDCSKGFLKLLGWDGNMKQKIFDHTYIEVILDPEFGIKDLLSEKEYPATVESMLKRFYFEMGFMKDDKYYNNTIAAIEKDPIAHKIWEGILANPPKFFNTLTSRTVVFKLYGFNIPLVYSIETMSSNNRFEMIEYTPTSRLIRLLNKLLFK